MQIYHRNLVALLVILIQLGVLIAQDRSSESLEDRIWKFALEILNYDARDCVHGIEGQNFVLFEGRMRLFKSEVELQMAVNRCPSDYYTVHHLTGPGYRDHSIRMPPPHDAKSMPLAFPAPPPVRPPFLTVGQYVISDPLFPAQWFLLNNENPGHDINVVPVWKRGIFGKNVTVAIVDDGVLTSHVDIAPRFYANSSWDVNDNQELPNPINMDPVLGDGHGTRCAGQIAAIPNGICGVGVAFEAQVAGIRMLGKRVASTDEAKVLTFHLDENYIFSCSWGPHDDGHTMEGPDFLNFKAILHGILYGRHGLGTIYVFATGNGGAVDNCNYDGYSSSLFTVAVGAIDELNRKPPYMEECSAQLFVTYSSGTNATTDFSSNTACTTKHGGTSAAAPIGAGLLALLLSHRPDLTWRDIQGIMIFSSRTFGIPAKDGKLSPDDIKYMDESYENWQQTQAGIFYHHQYAFGKSDADAMIRVADTWKNVNQHALFQVPKIEFREGEALIPFSNSESDGSGKKGLLVKVSVQTTEKQAVKKLEHVTVQLDIKLLGSTKRGDLEYYVQSPFGTVSKLAAVRPRDRASDFTTSTGRGHTYNGTWIFTSIVHWHESIQGEWRIFLSDCGDTGETGNRGISQLNSLTLVFWGEGEMPYDPIDFEYKARMEAQYVSAYFNLTTSPVDNAVNGSVMNFSVSPKEQIPWPPKFKYHDGIETPSEQAVLFLKPIPTESETTASSTPTPAVNTTIGNVNSTSSQDPVNPLNFPIDEDTAFNSVLFIVGILFSGFMLVAVPIVIISRRGRKLRRFGGFIAPWLGYRRI